MLVAGGGDAMVCAIAVSEVAAPGRCAVPAGMMTWTSLVVMPAGGTSGW